MTTTKAAQKIAKIVKHLTDKQTTRHHGRHIGLQEAKNIFGNHVVELEGDQAFRHQARKSARQTLPAGDIHDPDASRA